MIPDPVALDDVSSPAYSRRWNVRIAMTTLLLTGVAVAAVLVFVLTRNPSGVVQPGIVYPSGISDSSQPSGMAPPAADAMHGYNLNYVTEFAGTSVPPGWYLFAGVPGGLPGGQFALSHVVVSGGVLQLNTFRDPNYQNRWVTGGLCQCGLAQKYHADFVRSRITGAGPNEVQLLWPVSNSWPPEVDFNETGTSSLSTSATVHWGTANYIEQRAVKIDMTRWHTWGVIWTKSSIIYTVDGRAWGEIGAASEIPSVPMRIDFEQRASCQSGRDCPTHPVSMLIDWVAEYAPK